MSNKEDGFVGPLRLIFILSIFCAFFNELVKDHKDIKEIYTTNPIPHNSRRRYKSEICNNHLGNEFFNKWEDFESDYRQEAKIRRDSVLSQIPENERSEKKGNEKSN